jgi:intraflagellar transport protein 122
MPLCFRCLNTNPLINPKGDKCTTCSNPFIRSPISFEILPLIEFKPVKGITDDQVIEMIKSAALAKVSKPGFLEY